MTETEKDAVRRIGIYHLVGKMKEDAANGIYGFCKKIGGGDEEFFIKGYREPIYFSEKDRAALSADVVATNKKKCDDFRIHMQKMNAALKKVAISGSNLVVTEDFFVHDNMFYKTTQKVDIVKGRSGEMERFEVAKLTFEELRTILYTLASALMSLHKVNIVHGDIKFENFILTRSKVTGKLIPKLIDFDSSYFVGELFLPEETIGTPQYYSPELFRYIKEPGRLRKEFQKKNGRKPNHDERLRIEMQARETFRPQITTKGDVFAMGLVFYECIVGTMPKISNPEFTEVGAAVAASVPIIFDSILTPECTALIKSMLAKDAAARPDLSVVCDKIKNMKAFTTGRRLIMSSSAAAAARPVAPAPRPAPAAPGAARPAVPAAPGAPRPVAPAAGAPRPAPAPIRPAAPPPPPPPPSIPKGDTFKSAALYDRGILSVTKSTLSSGTVIYDVEYVDGRRSKGGEFLVRDYLDLIK